LRSCASTALQALLEIAAILGAGEQGAHVEGVDGASCDHLRHFAVDDHLGQPLGDGGLADAGLADHSGLFLRRRHRIWMVRSISCGDRSADRSCPAAPAR
jgi:hypothetical protein